MGEIARLSGMLLVLLALIGLLGWAGRDLPLAAAKTCPGAIGHMIGC